MSIIFLEEKTCKYCHHSMNFASYIFYLMQNVILLLDDLLFIYSGLVLKCFARCPILPPFKDFFPLCIKHLWYCVLNTSWLVWPHLVQDDYAEFFFVILIISSLNCWSFNFLILMTNFIDIWVLTWWFLCLTLTVLLIVTLLLE